MSNTHTLTRAARAIVRRVIEMPVDQNEALVRVSETLDISIAETTRRAIDLGLPQLESKAAKELHRRT